MRRKKKWKAKKSLHGWSCKTHRAPLTYHVGSSCRYSVLLCQQQPTETSIPHEIYTKTVARRGRITRLKMWLLTRAVFQVLRKANASETLIRRSFLGPWLRRGCHSLRKDWIWTLGLYVWRFATVAYFFFFFFPSFSSLFKTGKKGEKKRERYIGVLRPRPRPSYNVLLCGLCTHITSIYKETRIPSLAPRPCSLKAST